MTVKIIEGSLQANDARYGIAVARFNSFVVESLLDGAIDALERHGIDEEQIDVVRLPGAYELPMVVQSMAQTQRYDAIIGLGAVIRGGTPHFDYVAGESAKGLASVALEHDVPVIFGVITTDTIEQAIERSGTKAGNKGAEAAMSAIEMVNLNRQLAALGS